MIIFSNELSKAIYNYNKEVDCDQRLGYWEVIDTLHDPSDEKEMLEVIFDIENETQLLRLSNQ